MEFSLLDLNKMMIDLLDEQSTHVQYDSNLSATSEGSEASSLHEREQQQSLSTPDNSDKQYCLIIFNNPRWSQQLRKRAKRTEQQPTQSTAPPYGTTAVKEEKQDVSLDDQFISQLRQLFNNYMQHTKRPFPIKYFIDFSHR